MIQSELSQVPVVAGAEPDVHRVQYHQGLSSRLAFERISLLRQNKFKK
jgi:hypothetical protein